MGTQITSTSYSVSRYYVRETAQFEAFRYMSQIVLACRTCQAGHVNIENRQLHPQNFPDRWNIALFRDSQRANASLTPITVNRGRWGEISASVGSLRAVEALVETHPKGSNSRS